MVSAPAPAVPAAQRAQSDVAFTGPSWVCLREPGGRDRPPEACMGVGQPRGGARLGASPPGLAGRGVGELCRFPESSHFIFPGHLAALRHKETMPP